jgi:spermidine synthase
MDDLLVFLKKIFKPDISAISKINGQINLKSSYGHLTLFTNNIPQSGGEFVHMWHSVVSYISKTEINPKNILILGVGGGTVIMDLSKRFPKTNITGIEIDPVIIEMAKSHFHLREINNLNLITKDAINWINNNSQNLTYDIIVVDLFIHKFNPTKSRQYKFLNNLKKILSNDGILIFNCDYSEQNLERYLSFQVLLAQIYKSITEIYKFPLNRVLAIKTNL